MANNTVIEIMKDNLTFEEVLQYETFSSSLLASFLYQISTTYFVWVCQRKYKRYLEAKESLKKLSINKPFKK